MRENSQRIVAGALVLTVFVSTGCFVQNSQQAITEQQTQQSTISETEPETGAPVADTGEAANGVVNYGMMEDTSIRVEPVELTDKWDKVFPLSDEANHRKVTFVNHFDSTLAAGLYEPKEYTRKIPAIAVGGPFSTVKKQSSGLYAQEMTERGFLAIAFDPSFIGESGGYPRYFDSPDINIEGYRAAIDFLSTQDNVDPEQIGIIGIYGQDGMAFQTAALDTRVKATAAMTMYDMSQNAALGYFDPIDRDGRYESHAVYNRQRTGNYKNGTYALGGGPPEEAPEETPQYVKDCVAYYKTDRGYHPRSVSSNNGWAATAPGSPMNIRLFEYAPEIRSSVLLMHDEEARSLMCSHDAYELLQGDNRELLIIPGVTHTDLYDQADKIPFDRLESFFTEAFQQPMDYGDCAL